MTGASSTTSLAVGTQVDPMIEDGQEHWTPYQFGFDNAVRFNDPDGQNPFLIAGAAGAAIGAVVGAGIEAGTQMYHNGGHAGDWHAVGGAALQGGVTGGLAGLTGGTSLLRSGAVGAGSNVAGGIARNAYDGKPITVGSVAKDAAIGAAIGVAGHAAGKLAGAVINRVKGGAAAAEAEVGPGRELPKHLVAASRRARASAPAGAASLSSKCRWATPCGPTTSARARRPCGRSRTCSATSATRYTCCIRPRARTCVPPVLRAGQAQARGRLAGKPGRPAPRAAPHHPMNPKNPRFRQQSDPSGA